MSEVVLDSSAVLAFLRNEMGSDRVEPHVGRSLISAASFAETIAKLVEIGASLQDAENCVRALLVRVVPVTYSLARLAALLHPHTRSLGLSLGARCCLAVAIDTGWPVLTADRRWTALSVGANVEVIR